MWCKLLLFKNMKIVFFFCKVTKKLSEGVEKRSSREKGPAPPPPIVVAKIEEPGTLVPDDLGSSSLPDRTSVTESSESLFNPEVSSVQPDSGKQASSPSQQETSLPVLPVNGTAAETAIIRPSLGKDSSWEEGVEKESKVELSATKTCDRNDNSVTAVDKPNIALVTTPPDEVASNSASGDITIFSGRFFYLAYLLHFTDPSENCFKFIMLYKVS
jgi:hypothetical protein